jgi:hypothetical protein
MKHDLYSGEKTKCAMGREGLCLETRRRVDELFLNILLWTAIFHKNKQRSER